MHFLGALYFDILYTQILTTATTENTIKNINWPYLHFPTKFLPPVGCTANILQLSQSSLSCTEQYWLLIGYLFIYLLIYLFILESRALFNDNHGIFFMTVGFLFVGHTDVNYCTYLPIIEMHLLLFWTLMIMASW